MQRSILLDNQEGVRSKFKGQSSKVKGQRSKVKDLSSTPLDNQKEKFWSEFRVKEFNALIKIQVLRTDLYYLSNLSYFSY